MSGVLYFPLYICKWRIFAAAAAFWRRSSLYFRRSFIFRSLATEYCISPFWKWLLPAGEAKLCGQKTERKPATTEKNSSLPARILCVCLYLCTSKTLNMDMRERESLTLKFKFSLIIIHFRKERKAKNLCLLHYSQIWLPQAINGAAPQVPNGNINP